MKSAFAHLLTVSVLLAGYHITIKHGNDSTSLPVLNTGKLYFEDGALLSSKGGIDIPVENISTITFSIKDIDPVVKNSVFVENDAHIKKRGNFLELNFSTLGSEAQKATLFLVNLQGRVVVKKELQLGAHAATLDLSECNLASGLYTIVCTVDQRTIVEKLILK